MEGTSRTEAFSDGVFAIAITLLVLEIRLPEGERQGELLADLASIWPSYLAFLLSFFMIAVTWISHHDMTRLLQGVNRTLLLANAFFLMYVSFVPFSTRVLADHFVGADAPVAVALYCAVFIVGSFASMAVLEAAVQGGLLRPVIDEARRRRVRRALLAGLVVNVLATAIAFVLPYLALVIILLVRVGWLRLHWDAAPAARGAPEAAVQPT